MVHSHPPMHPKEESQERERWPRGWRHGSAIQSSYCSPREQEFGYQHCGSSQTPVAPVPGDPTLLSHLHGQLYTHTGSYMYIYKASKKRESWPQTRDTEESSARHCSPSHNRQDGLKQDHLCPQSNSLYVISSLLPRKSPGKGKRKLLTIFHFQPNKKCFILRVSRWPPA